MINLDDADSLLLCYAPADTRASIVRITLLANRDLPSNLALNYLVKALPQEYPLTLFLSESVGRAQSPPAAQNAHIL
jgi:hypothetical protein